MSELIYPAGILYSAGHEWLRPEGAEAFIGITSFAAAAFGSILNVSIAALGTSLEKGQVFGSIQTAKTHSELFMPVAGIILETNIKVHHAPGLINLDPYEWGWLLKICLIKPQEAEGLFSAEAYQQIL